VLSSRPPVRAAADAGLRRVRAAASHFREIRIGPGEQEHRAVLRAYVEKRLAQRRPDDQPPLPAAWAEPLIDKAEGSFLYVFHYCRALHFGVYDDLSSLPPPSAFYPRFFDHLRSRVSDELFEKCYARTLALIAAAREPVGMTHLTEWGLERGRLIAVLNDLADLLRTRREPWDAETLYSLGHDAIRQFLSADPAWQDRIDAAHRFLAETAVQRFGHDWYAADPFDPAERYLLLHLLDHAKEQELRERLLADIVLPAAYLDQGNRLCEMREVEPSLLACEAVLEMREDQVVRQGRHELRNDLARAYMNRGIALADLGRLPEALADYGACIALREELVQREGRRELRHDLANAYMNRGNALGMAGRLEEALVDLGACIKLREQLVQREGRRELRNDLACAHINRGVCRQQLGRLGEALADLGACIGLFETMVRHEGRHELRNNLAATYANRGNALMSSGRLGEALADYGACIDLYEALVQREDRRELRNDLACAYMGRGNALRSSGRLEDAIADHGACIALREQLVQREDRRELRHDLANAYMNRGNALMGSGRLGEALVDYGACIDLYEALVQREDRRELRNNLAQAYMNRGNALSRSGQLTEGLADYGASIALREQLVRREDRCELAGDLGWGYAAKANLILKLATARRLAAYWLRRCESSVTKLRGRAGPIFGKCLRSPKRFCRMRAGRNEDPAPLGERRGVVFPVGARSLLGDEQLVNLLVVQLHLALAGVDDQGRAAGRHPHQVVAEPVHVLHLRLQFEDAEVGVALRLDHQRRRLGVELLVDPDAADLDAVAAVGVTLGRLLQPALIPQVGAIDG
jgi:tetratricopeptide (TPR) repeat protein